MTEQIKNILIELKAIQAKLPELRDLFWLKIDRYNEADQQRGVAFDEKFEQQRDKLFRVIDSFSAFIEKSFAPNAEEIAKEKALQKLRVEFPGFDGWNEEAKKALLEREMIDLLKTRTRIADNSMGFSKRRIKDEGNGQKNKNGQEKRLPGFLSVTTWNLLFVLPFFNLPVFLIFLILLGFIFSTG